MDNLTEIAEQIRATFEAKSTARDSVINMARSLTRQCANAIRAIHRQEWETAGDLLGGAHETLTVMVKNVKPYPDLYYAGYTQDAVKEFVEASLTLALVRDEQLPTPHALGVEESTYLNGLTEAASELRRYILDIIRDDHSDRAERLLKKMDSIYDVLVTFDFADAITGGLRHRTDSLRGVLEKTRGDVTMSIRQQRLESTMAKAIESALPDIKIKP